VRLVVVVATNIPGKQGNERPSTSGDAARDRPPGSTAKHGEGKIVASGSKQLAQFTTCGQDNATTNAKVESRTVVSEIYEALLHSEHRKSIPRCEEKNNLVKSLLQFSRSSSPLHRWKSGMLSLKRCS